MKSYGRIQIGWQPDFGLHAKQEHREVEGVQTEEHGDSGNPDAAGEDTRAGTFRAA